MSLKIARLYPTWLTLYGDNANIKALKHYLKADYNVDSIVDDIDDLSNVDIMDYDVMYIGSGMDSGLRYAEENLVENKSKIMKYIEYDKVFISTGNSISCFKNFGFYKIASNEDYFVSDVVGTLLMTGVPIRAFQNTKYLIDSDDNVNTLFKLEKGYGNSAKTGQNCSEGYRYKNYFATSLIGPILAINEDLRNKFLDRIIMK